MRKLIYTSIYQFIMLPSITIKKFHSPEACHIFLFLKFADDRGWFFLLHESHDFQNNLDCPTGTFASPEGDVSKVTSFAYDKVWVENIHCWFIAICGVKSR